MSAIYRWKPQAGVNIDPQLAGETLEALRIRQNGYLTPRAVVDAARAPDNPLHPAFEWDDAKAAQAHREDQARYLLRQIVVEVPQVTKENRPVRAFVNVARGEGDRGYSSTVVALGNAETRSQILAQAWRELQGWRQRYQDFEELAEVISAIESNRPDDL